jgi:hypothetical protein
MVDQAVRPPVVDAPNLQVAPGLLQMGPNIHRTVMTEIPKNLNDQLRKLGLAPLFASPPKP